ncbi:hypothetical protein GDO86_014330 [Hymenochirus boettgeri]|uniref:Uncharacterized protein n=1 Tax=Hymenochirus boettgeri TaxID=247094 RepID=A0A8T2JTS5_9PIPI|nr:hypothetical protein GDO86_014330 [Hymenochirus boettgeri]
MVKNVFPGIAKLIWYSKIKLIPHTGLEERSVYLTCDVSASNTSLGVIRASVDCRNVIFFVTGVRFDYYTHLWPRYNSSTQQK